MGLIQYLIFEKQTREYEEMWDRMSPYTANSIKQKWQFLDGFENDTTEARIARGNEPIPGGRFASKIKRAIIMEDDWLNEIQKDLYLVRAYLTNKDSKESVNLDKYKVFLYNWGFRSSRSEDGSVYYEQDNVPSEVVDAITKDIEENNYKIKIKTYEQKWARGDLYRARHLRYNMDMARNYCAYCGRRIHMGEHLKDGEFPLEVDHVIPVAKLLNDEKMEDGTSYRELAHTLGITRTDSPRNLVSTCHECNSNKQTRTKGYIKKAVSLGRYKWYWELKRGAVTVAIIVAILLVWYLWQWA